MSEAWEVLAEDEPDADLAMLAAQLGRMLFFEGKREQAAEMVERALELAEALELPEVLSQALNTKAIILGSAGRSAESHVLLRHALEIALEHGLSSATLRAYNNLSAGLSATDQHVEALEVMDQAAVYARKVGDRGIEIVMRIAVVGDSVPLGRWDEALAAHADLRDEESSIIVWSEAVNLTHVLVARGDLEEAERLLSLQGDLSASEDLQIRSIYLMNLAKLRAAQGRWREALQAGAEAFGTGEGLGYRALFVNEGLVEAIEAAFALGDAERIETYLGWIQQRKPGELTPYLRAHGARSAARWAALQGDATAADGSFRAATAAFRELPNPYWLARTLLDHGVWLHEQSRADDAEPPLEEARRIFTELRADPWIERVDAHAEGARRQADSSREAARS